MVDINKPNAVLEFYEEELTEEHLEALYMLLSNGNDETGIIQTLVDKIECHFEGMNS